MMLATIQSKKSSNNKKCNKMTISDPLIRSKESDKFKSSIATQYNQGNNRN